MSGAGTDQLDPGRSLTTFTDRLELARAQQLLDRLDIGYEVVSPDPGYERVGCPALVLTAEARAEYLDNGGAALVSAGWVEHRPSRQGVPEQSPASATEELIPGLVIVVLAPCVADPEKLRLIAHLEGDAAEALPYLNSELHQASYTAKLPVLTYMDGHRMVSLFRDRVGIAKADDIVDAWATLERLRSQVNEVWARREEIEPSFEACRRPPALEILKRLPGSSCGECGEATCNAFAWAVWRGDADPQDCTPVFEGSREDLREALLAVCAGMGLEEKQNADPGPCAPAKVYVEPTTACNLACATCVRHAWDEPEGFVEWATFEAVVDGVAGPADEGGPADEDGPGTIAFMGLGEPLLHPRFPDMVRAAKERGLRTEVTTNALLLDDTMAAALLEAGLDQLVVSIDGASAEAFGRVRGVSLSRVVENVSRLHDGRGPNYSSRGRSSAAPSSGAYRLVRHPMYGGVLPLALGWALVFDPAEWHDGAGGSSGGALDLAHRE